jgi:hypothetical protein
LQLHQFGLLVIHEQLRVSKIQAKMEKIRSPNQVFARKLASIGFQHLPVHGN